MSDRTLQWKVLEEVGGIEEGSAWTLEVNIISWDGKPPKIDVRRWNEAKDKMSKGLSFTRAEVEALIPLLKDAVGKMKD